MADTPQTPTPVAAAPPQPPPLDPMMPVQVEVEPGRLVPTNVQALAEAFGEIAQVRKSLGVEKIDPKQLEILAKVQKAYAGDTTAARELLDTLGPKAPAVEASPQDKVLAGLQEELKQIKAQLQSATGVTEQVQTAARLSQIQQRITQDAAKYPLTAKLGPTAAQELDQLFRHKMGLIAQQGHSLDRLEQVQPGIKQIFVDNTLKEYEAAKVALLQQLGFALPPTGGNGAARPVVVNDQVRPSGTNLQSSRYQRIPGTGMFIDTLAAPGAAQPGQVPGQLPSFIPAPMIPSGTQVHGLVPAPPTEKPFSLDDLRGDMKSRVAAMNTSY